MDGFSVGCKDITNNHAELYYLIICGIAGFNTIFEGFILQYQHPTYHQRTMEVLILHNKFFENHNPLPVESRQYVGLLLICEVTDRCPLPRRLSILIYHVSIEWPIISIKFLVDCHFIATKLSFAVKIWKHTT